MSRTTTFRAFIAAVFMTIGFATSSFASPNNGGNEFIKAAFHKDFAKGELMTIEARTTYTKLTFKLNDMVMFAFYSESGELMAVTRNIRSSQLPIRLMMELKNDYSNFWITDLCEMTMNGQNNYYVTLENADKKIVLRSNDTNSWDRYNQ